jgi:fructokinase
MQRPMRVLGIGELLWDLFPDGPRLGGAPFNVIADLRRLGHPAAFVTAVGDDDLGRAALAAAADFDIDTRFISVAADLPTGTVDVVPDERLGHRFQIASPAAYEALDRDGEAAARVADWAPQALAFGTLAQRSPATLALTRGIAAALGTAPRLYDVNLRDGCWTPELVLDLLPIATIVKVNEAEAAMLAELLDADDDLARLGARLETRYGTQTLCVTRGESGAAMWTDGRTYAVEGIPIEVADTVGAGDAFAAALLHGVLSGWAPARNLASANRLGALVASRPGALPDWQVDEVR